MDRMIDRRNPLPKYSQLQNIFRDLIVRGEWAKEDRIPSESVLVTKYTVCRQVIRQAIGELCKEGLLERRQGLGTFVVATQPAISPEEKLNLVYRERNCCVALLVRMALALGWKAGIREDPEMDEGWRHVVYIDLPSGQVSWHLRDEELSNFADVPRYTAPWDGHTTEEKYERVLHPFEKESRISITIPARRSDFWKFV